MGLSFSFNVSKRKGRWFDQSVALFLCGLNFSFNVKEEKGGWRDGRFGGCVVCGLEYQL